MAIAFNCFWRFVQSDLRLSCSSRASLFRGTILLRFQIRVNGNVTSVQATIGLVAATRGLNRLAAHFSICSVGISSHSIVGLVIAIACICLTSSAYYKKKTARPHYLERAADLAPCLR